MIELVITGTVATLAMARPPVNAIDEAFLDAFEAAARDIERNDQIAIVVIRSRQRCFSAGADLARIGSCFGRDDGPQEMVDYVRRFHELFRRIELLPAVTVSVINGAALGGGLELALSCDLRMAGQSALLGLPEARVGMIPGAGGTQRLTRLCGVGVASRLILTGETVGADEAVRLGLVQWSVPDDQLENRVEELVNRISSLSRPALVAAKDCLRAYFDPDVDGYARELEKPLILMRTIEAQQRIEAFISRAGR
jgi:enoyl-CoA hydratase/carnithine racemase